METLPERITTKDLAERLRIAPSKLKFWVNKLELNVPKDASGSWRFSPEHIEVLERVRVLRELDDRTMETVRRVVMTMMPARPAEKLPVSDQEAVENPSLEGQPARGEVAGQLPGSDRDVSPDGLSTERIVAAIEDLEGALHESLPTSRSIGLAVAQHLAPEFATVERARKELVAASEQSQQQLLAALSASQHLADRYAIACHDVACLKGENQRLAAQLEALERKVMMLPVPKSKPWWRFWGS